MGFRVRVQGSRLRVETGWVGGGAKTGRGGRGGRGQGRGAGGSKAGGRKGHRGPARRGFNCPWSWRTVRFQIVVAHGGVPFPGKKRGPTHGFGGLGGGVPVLTTYTPSARGLGGYSVVEGAGVGVYEVTSAHSFQ